MLESIGETGAVVLLGLLGGIGLGLAARLGRFCTLGMIEDAHFGSDRGRSWMWATALGVAMLLNFAAEAAGLIDLGQTLYLGTALPLHGAVIGGLLFGYGMAHAGNCGFGVLARLGGGDLRALVIALVMGVTALITISGLLAGLRISLFPATPSPDAKMGLAHGLGAMTGVSATVIGMGVGVVLLAASVYFQTPGKRMLRVFWGAVVGIAITSGFVGTAWIAANGFEAWPVVSHSFTAPIGDTIYYAMFSSALAPKFGIGSVIGVVLGGFLGSLIQNGFRWEACDDPRQLRRQLSGAALMGVGAVLAAGCSVGQGLSGLAVLGVTAPVAAAAIWLGAWVGLRQLIYGHVPAE